MVTTYNPDKAPDREGWLRLDEPERVALVVDYHQRARTELPSIKVHAAIHTVVETQLAEEIDAVVDALERLRRGGLDRHDAIHAIGGVLSRVMHTIMTGGAGQDPNELYFASLKTLTADDWRNS